MANEDEELHPKNNFSKNTYHIIITAENFKRKSLNEKLEIALYEGENLRNKKKELISKCRHQNKFMLLRHDSKDRNRCHFYRNHYIVKLR